MTAPGSMPGYGDGRGYGGDDGGYSGAPESRERGGKRKKLAGYLKAANELRQTYSASYAEKWGARGSDEYHDEGGIPGAFPDVAIVQHGDEEMVLFPSYARRHIKTQPKVDPWNSNQFDGDSEIDDAEYWRKEWEKFEDDKAIVNVDVRGWIYSPHRGPLNRKNRLLIGLARQLSGIPAPKADRSGENSPDPSVSLRARHEAHEAKREQERIAKEADEILKKGEDEEKVAERGGYSEKPFTNYDSDRDSVYGDRRPSHTPPHSSQLPSPGTSHLAHKSSGTLDDDAPGPGYLPKRTSWNQPSDMSQEELLAANTHLMSRLRPFLTNPIVSAPITVFFYDEKRSQSRTIMTNEAGHFNLRAALDFVPTHVRVLASEHLSATEEVKIMEPKGVSLISDVDDTIKHSSIGSGAREIFRNAFIRDLGDLTIQGVKEWYNTMYDMGVGIHYVSNSPWQLFPVLVSFFRLAGLPPGSYHLKQYSGMLQGIFEPVAERKKGTLERIMRDFPQRKFLLIGDSGEADLEVYTDVVLANPGRIIAVFIRDVTTPTNQGFFDSSMGLMNGERRKGSLAPPPDMRKPGDSRSSKITDFSDSPASRPPLPSRPKTEVKEQTSSGPAMGMLIDLSEEPEQINVHESHKHVLPRSMSDFEHIEKPTIKPVANDNSKGKLPPVRPSKPLALRGSQSELNMKVKSDKKTPPPPPKPRRLASMEGGLSQSTASQHPLSQTQNTSDIKPPPPPQEQSYMSSARQKVSSAYNSLPAASSMIPGRSVPQNPRARSNIADGTPPPPPRRAQAAQPAPRSSWRSDRSTDTSDDEYYESVGPQAPVNKKLQLWKTRLAKAKNILDREGVELRTWRVGEDICLDAVRLVEKNLREMGIEGYGGGEKKVKDIKR